MWVARHRSIVYKLIGVVLHHGIHADSGHYVSYFHSNINDIQWFYGDDVEVCESITCTYNVIIRSRIIELKILQVLPVSIATVLQQKPYLLFYKRETICKHFTFFPSL